MNQFYPTATPIRKAAAGILFLTLLCASTHLDAQIFPAPGFTLPPGKTIVITYEVDVNGNVCPGGTVATDISNQSSVDGDNIPMVLTNEPSNPAADPSPTLTPVSGLTLGNLVYQDNNKNGIFDAGDTGVNGVLLSLYADNGDGVLTAADGAAIATVTTAGGGLYTFGNLCPGSYLVEVAPSNFNVGQPLHTLVSSPTAGASDPDNDINNDDNGDPVAGFGVATQAITLALGTEPVNDGDADNNTNLSLDFGFKTPTTVTINDVTLAEGTGGSTTAFSFTVTRSDNAEAFSLTVNTADGTATAADNDFAAITNGTVSFTAGGSLTETVTVLVNHDNKVETNETFSVVLSGAPAGVTITDGTGAATITNDDAATVTLSGAASQNEGNAGNVPYPYTLTLNNPVQGGFSITVTLAGATATFPTDFNGPTVGFTFTGTAGETKTGSAGIIGDQIVELDETFTVNLSAPSGAPAGVTVAGSPLTVTILNDDQATVTIANVSQNEGNAGNTPFTFTVTLSNPVDAAVNMNYATVDGTATIANNDYASASGAVPVFAANGAAGATQTVTVNVVGDMAFESNETFLLRLSGLAASGRNVVFSPGAGATVDGTATILNDDIPPVIINEVDADNPGADAAEFVELYDGGVGNTSLNGMVLVFYNGATDQSYLAIDLDGFSTNANGYFIAGNAGVPGVDAIFAGNILQNGQDAVALYTGDAANFPLNTPVTTANLIDALVYDTNDADDPGLLVLLNAGQPQIDEAGNGNPECNSMQRITNGSGGPRNTSTYQVLPPTPDAANFVPLVSVAVSPASVNEDGVTNLTYTITRTGATTCDLSVPFTVSGTATAGTDYPGITPSPIVIPAGSASVTITVDPTIDNTVEPNETVIITLVDGTQYDLGASTAATGTITNDDAAVVILSGTGANEGNAGTTTFTFLVSIDNPVQGGFTLPYTTNDGTAIAPTDFTDNDGTLTFVGTAGETKTITVLVNGDNLVELDEQFTVALGAITGAPAGVTTSGSPANGNITNDDAAIVNLAANISQAEAAGPHVYSITMSNPVDVPVTVQFSTINGTATTADNDFNGLNNFDVVFPAGSNTTQTVNVTINNDSKVEADETFGIVLGGPASNGRNVSFGATSTGTGTIVNDDAATVTLAGGGSANEGNTGTTPRVFTATLNNPVQGGFTLPYTTSDGTATAGSDYIDNDATLTFTGTAGEVKNITVLVNGDFAVEANETFTVNLGAIAGAPAGVTTAGSPQTGTILNDEVDWGDGPDSLPTLSFYNGARHNTLFGFQLGAAIDGESDGQAGPLANGDGADDDGVTLPSAFVTGTTATITVNASQAGKLDAWMDFNWNRQLGDAGEKIFNNVALVAGDNTLSFAVPANAVVGVSYLRFRFSSAGGLAHTGAAADGEVEDYRVQIVNNQFSITSPTITEGNAGTTNLTFTISRTTNNVASSVDYAITGGTATAGGDYTTIPAGTVNFTAGGALSQTVTVSVNGDIVVENNETVIVTLSNPVNGGIATGTGTGTITNDDNATLTLSGGSSVNETNAGTVTHTYTATLSAAVQGGFTVAYATNNGTATAGSDYTDNDGTLTFAGTAGETQTITVQSNGDVTVELNETFTETLGAIGATSAVQAAAISVSGSPQTTTLVNDDAATVSIAGNVSQAENLTPQVFTVTLSNPVDVAVTVLFSTSDGTATTADNDYNAVNSQTVTFAANSTTSQTVNVTINNDNKVEANEVYNVALGSLNASGRNVSLGTTTGTGTIVNDDNAVVTLTGQSSQPEGGPGTNTTFVFTATLSNPVQGGFTVPYVTNNSSATGADYIDNDGTLTFAGTAGETQTITVLGVGDFIVENNESFRVDLVAIVGAPGPVTFGDNSEFGTMLNDEVDYGDAPDTYGTLLASNGPRHDASLAVYLDNLVDGDANGQPNATGTGDDTDAEGDDDKIALPSVFVTGTTANITVFLNGSLLAGKLDAFFDWNNNGSFADAGEKVFNSINLVDGDNILSVPVPVGATPSTTFARFRVSSAGGLSFNGPAPDGEVEDYQIQIVNTQYSINDPTVTEGNAGTTNLAFVITRSNNASATSVNYAITGGTATVADNDYQTLAAGTASFTAGGALTQTVNVVVNGDVKVELNETVDMTLSNPVNGTILDGSGTGNIVNDDAGTITISNPTVTEGDVPNTVAMTFAVSMSNPVDANVSMNFTTVDGTATAASGDYVANSGTVTFTPGVQNQTLTVTVNGDCAIETAETLLLRLSALNANGRNVSFSGGGATLDGTGTITNDDALPVITCPANLTVNTDPGQCLATVTIPGPFTANICGASTLEWRYRTMSANGTPVSTYSAYAPAAASTIALPPNYYEVEWRITDGSGASTCSFLLRVLDSQPPTMQCQNATVQLNAAGTASITAATVNNNSFDNCGIAALKVEPNAFTCANLGSNTVTLTGTDLSGNTATCTAIVTIVDAILPTALCKNATLNIGASGTTTIPPALINNGSSDNCAFTLSVTPATLGCANIGNNVVTLRVTDQSGNTRTCTAIVTVSDATPPQALCKNISVFLNTSGQASITPAMVNNGTSDPCGLASLTINRSAFSCMHLSSPQAVVLRATDNNGNSSTCISYVTVEDNIPPTPNCVSNITVSLNSSGYAIVNAQPLAAGSYDNCSIVQYTPSSRSYTCANLGANNFYTFSMRDYDFNTATCTVQVTVLQGAASCPPSNLAVPNDDDKFGVPASVPGAGPVLEMTLMPNPARDETTVGFVLDVAAPVTVRVFDVTGRTVLLERTDGYAGENLLPLRVPNWPSGVYIVELQAGDLRGQRRLVVTQQ